MNSTEAQALASATEEQITEARDWASDCIGLVGGRKVSAECAIKYVEANYPGGWAGFLAEIFPCAPETAQLITDADVAPGDRIRVTRYRSDGTVKFVKTGTVLERYGYAYRFNEDDTASGCRMLSNSESLAKGMPGWSQTIERLDGGE